MLLYLGWIAAAFLMGFLLSDRLKSKSLSLRKRVEKAAYFRGKPYREVIREIGETHTEIRQKDGHILRTWAEDGYSVSLLFDERDLCLGVEDEYY